MGNYSVGNLNPKNICDTSKQTMLQRSSFILYLSLQILSEPVPSIQTDVLKALLVAHYTYSQSSVNLGFRIFKRNYTYFYHTFAFTSATTSFNRSF